MLNTEWIAILQSEKRRGVMALPPAVLLAFLSIDQCQRPIQS